MTHRPPHMDDYEEQVRLRVAASNYSPAEASSTSPRGLPSSEEAIEPQMATTAGSSNPAQNTRKTVVMALVSGAILSLVAVAFLVVPQIFGQANGLSPKQVEQVVAEGPPYADSLTAAQMYDAYISMNRSGTIYRIIPNTDDGRRYFRAFMYAVTDLKIAESFSGGMSSEQARDLIEREKHFLALEDLDLDIDITHTDGTREILNGLPPKRD